VHLLGYARVSTTEQNPDLQVDELAVAGHWNVWTDRPTDRPTGRRGRWTDDRPALVPQADAELRHSSVWPEKRQRRL